MLMNEQTILGIEGSGFSVSVGLMEKGMPLGNLFLNTGQPGSESLLYGIDQLLALTGTQKSALDGICVARGPGAFTSLRICLATAEALGLALGIPVYGVDNLTLIAATVPFYPNRVRVVQNAYKGEFYTADFNTKNGKAELMTKLGLIKPAVFVEQLQQDDLILGNGLSKLVKMGFNLESRGVYWNQDFSRVVSGIGVIEHFLEQEAVKPDGVPLEPIYIRLSEAELNYEKQFGKR